MISIEELIEYARAADERVKEARATVERADEHLQLAVHKMQEALRFIDAVTLERYSNSMVDYASSVRSMERLVNDARASLEGVPDAAAAGLELSETYVNNLHG